LNRKVVTGNIYHARLHGWL